MPRGKVGHHLSIVGLTTSSSYCSHDAHLVERFLTAVTPQTTQTANLAANRKTSRHSYSSPILDWSVSLIDNHIEW